MDGSVNFWGTQGRVGFARSGPWSGRFVFVYPDTLPEWWTVVVSPSPTPGVPGDMYLEGNAEVSHLFTQWNIDWLPPGTEEEQRIETEEFGWRPLRAASNGYLSMIRQDDVG